MQTVYHVHGINPHTWEPVWLGSVPTALEAERLALAGQRAGLIDVEVSADQATVVYALTDWPAA